MSGTATRYRTVCIRLLFLSTSTSNFKSGVKPSRAVIDLAVPGSGSENAPVLLRSVHGAPMPPWPCSSPLAHALPDKEKRPHSSCYRGSSLPNAEASGACPPSSAVATRARLAGLKEEGSPSSSSSAWFSLDAGAFFCTIVPEPGGSGGAGGPPCALI